VIVPIKNGIVHPLILGDGNSLGIRIPNHPFCKALSQSIPNPIITTSVNRTGKAPMCSPEKIEMEFANDVDLIIEDGELSASASRIYIYKKGELNILRP
jgi:L-threonylcarbamoyladenylate synthase